MDPKKLFWYKKKQFKFRIKEFINYTGRHNYLNAIIGHIFKVLYHHAAMIF